MGSGFRACTSLIGYAALRSAPCSIRRARGSPSASVGAAAASHLDLLRPSSPAWGEQPARPTDLQLRAAGGWGRGMPGCRISACGPGAQEGSAEPGSPPPPPPREPLSCPQPPSPSPTLTPTRAQASSQPGAAQESAGSAEGLELQRWRQGASGGAGGPGPAGGAGGGSGAAAAAAGVRALELAEARRRLLEVEGRRRLVSELESRVLQLHRVFLAAELRLAHRAESLGRLGGGVAQAELYLAAHGPRLKKGSRRVRRARPPALLASALGLGGCVPWGAGRLRRGHGPEPESPFRRSPPRGPASPQR
ncbi:TMF-regulated nuclear protein 1 [Bos taurus]|nr:TMF-regulated nuclear protein 1 [Bos taurus]XP_024838213.2 TMF-regulated nuclear protein 1 [Bos taurus]XP_024838221.2 TMF-regulated nuclear protein 1 [Bos taurus]XP_024838224.2 TMF-regulated nuclear protein 1 [Bos taurus]